MTVKKNRLARCIALVLCMVVLLSTGSAAHVYAAGSAKQSDEETQEKYKSVVKAVICTGNKGTLGIENAKGSVKWSVADKDILQIVRKMNKMCRVKALKDGRTSVRASAKNTTVTYKVTIKSGKTFVKSWCRLYRLNL